MKKVGLKSVGVMVALVVLGGLCLWAGAAGRSWQTQGSWGGERSFHALEEASASETLEGAAPPVTLDKNESLEWALYQIDMRILGLARLAQHYQQEARRYRKEAARSLDWEEQLFQEKVAQQYNRLAMQAKRQREATEAQGEIQRTRGPLDPRKGPGDGV